MIAIHSSQFRGWQATARRAVVLVIALTAVAGLAGQNYTVTTLAGSPLMAGLVDGTGNAVRFHHPDGITIQKSTGYFFIGDEGNHAIRRIVPSTGVVTTIAGNGTSGTADGTGSAAQFHSPEGVAPDAGVNLYVADSNNQTIRLLVSNTGVVTTFAGTAGAAGSADGTGAAARFKTPYGVATDLANNVYVADLNNYAIRKITPAGVVTTLAGSLGTAGSADGTGSAARFTTVTGLALDATGNVFVCDSASHTIRKVTPAGVVTTLAGAAGIAGSVDGTGSAARFNYPYGLCVDSAGNLFVADTANSTIRKVTPDGVVTTVLGLAGTAGSADGSGPAARMNNPQGVAINRSGVLYIADSSNHTVRTAVAPPPVNDNFASAFTLTGTFAHATASNAGATKEVGEPNHAGGGGGQSVWWKWVAPRTGNVTLSTIGSSFDTVLGLYTGTAVNGLTTVASNDDTGGHLTSKLIAAVTAGTTYYIAVDGYGYSDGADSGAVSLNLFYGIVSGDLNADSKGDLVLTNASTGERAVWLMNGTTIASGATLGVLPTNWVFSASGDFNGDGKVDILLTDTSTGDRAMWLMNGATISTGATVGNLPLVWVVSATGDFNGDGKTDILLTNTATGERVIWLMNGATILSGSSLGILPLNYAISGTGDFNGDGKSDILLTDVNTGERVVWQMDGATITIGTSLGVLPTTWTIAGTGDFNGDSKYDILLSNTTTGERAIWIMDGATIASGMTVNVLPPIWTISRVADFNGDGRADIFLTNNSTGERVIWLMNGATISSGASLGILATNWTFLSD